MEIVFANDYTPFLGLIVAMLLAITVYSRSMEKARAMKFGNYETLEKVTGGNFLRSSNILMILKLAAIILIILGIAGPTVMEETSTTNASYILALDSSSSMFTTDIEPNRFDAAKDISKNILDQTTNQSRIGIVSYAGSTEVVSRPRKGIIENKRSIDNISIGDEAGTAIGEAVITSGALFSNNTGLKRIILLTDGKNNVGASINESISFAERNNISVYTIGLGETNKSNTEYDVVGGENASQADYPNLDTEQLDRLSNETGGRSVFVTENTDIDPEFVGISMQSVEHDLSSFFIFAGAFLLILEWFLKSTKIEVIP